MGTIAIVNKGGEDASEIAVAMLKMLAHKNSEALGIASSNNVRIEKSIDSPHFNGVDSSMVVGHVFSKIFAHDRPQPIKLDGSAIVFDGRVYPSSMEIFDAEAVTQELQNGRESAKSLIKKLNGCFNFVIAESKRIIAGRDAVGLHPFYYGENDDLAALGSECKALWRIGIKDLNSFPPGHLAVVDRRGFEFQSVKTLTYSPVRQIAMGAAAKKLQMLLQNSVAERVRGLEEVAIAFSGGLDSSIIAFLAKKSGANVRLIYVSLENQPETEHAKDVAEELKLPLCIYLYNEEDVDKIVSKVLWLVEESDSMKVSIGIPCYWTAEKVAELELKVLLAGQGADELFGGYKRYVNDYLRYNGEKVRRAIFKDIGKMYEVNFERDSKICNSHNVELRLPFATYSIAKFATELPLELKIERKENGLRKLILRRVAKNLGLPESIVNKPKKAVQYATGVNNILKKLAGKRHLPVEEYLQRNFRKVLKQLGEYE